MERFAARTLDESEPAHPLGTCRAMDPPPRPGARAGRRADGHRERDAGRGTRRPRPRLPPAAWRRRSNRSLPAAQLASASQTGQPPWLSRLQPSSGYGSSPRPGMATRSPSSPAGSPSAGIRRRPSSRGCRAAPAQPLFHAPAARPRHRPGRRRRRAPDPPGAARPVQRTSRRQLAEPDVVGADREDDHPHLGRAGRPPASWSACGGSPKCPRPPIDAGQTFASLRPRAGEVDLLRHRHGGAADRRHVGAVAVVLLRRAVDAAGS